MVFFGLITVGAIMAETARLPPAPWPLLVSTHLFCWSTTGFFPVGLFPLTCFGIGPSRWGRGICGSPSRTEAIVCRVLASSVVASSCLFVLVHIGAPWVLNAAWFISRLRLVQPIAECAYSSWAVGSVAELPTLACHSVLPGFLFLS